MNFGCLIALIWALVIAHAWAHDCGKRGASIDGECQSGLALAPALLQTKSKTESMSFDIVDDLPALDATIAGSWLHDEMTGVTFIELEGSEFWARNPSAQWNPAHGHVDGDTMTFDSPKSLEGETAVFKNDAVFIGGLELRRAPATETVPDMLLQRATETLEGAGTRTLDLVIKTKCAHMTVPMPGGFHHHLLHQYHAYQPEIRSDKWSFAWSVKPHTQAIGWPSPCSRSGLAFNKCHRNPGDRHDWCLRDEVIEKHWDAEDWGYCRLCPGSVVPPVCAWPTLPDGTQPKPRMDQWAFVYSVKPQLSMHWPVACSGMPLGRCGPEDEWDRPNYQHKYCLRDGVATKTWDQPDWGYCRRCPVETVERHKIRYMMKDNPFISDYFPTRTTGNGRCSGDFMCDDGKVCVDSKCSTPPSTIWNIEKKVQAKYLGHTNEIKGYIEELKQISAQITRDQTKVLANVAILVNAQKRRWSLGKLVHKSSMQKQMWDCIARAQSFDNKDSSEAEGKTRELIEIVGGWKREFDEIELKLSDMRPVVREQAKMLHARRQTMEKRLMELEQGKARPTSQRQKHKTNFDDDVKKDLKKKKDNKERGSLIEYKAEEKARFADLGFLTIDGDITLQIGECAPGLCASAGASVEINLVHVAYEDDNTRVELTSKTRVYVEAEGTVGCNKKGCQITVNASAGVSTEADATVVTDLGNGVSFTAGFGVEAGVVAEADAAVGCTSKKGCKVKAKAWAGAYAQVDMSRKIGSEAYNAQVGGSLMAGAAAGAGGHVTASYTDGKISLGGELCVQVIVGICGNLEINLDIGPLEDLIEDFAEEAGQLAGEAAEGVIEFGNYLADEADEFFDDATETLSNGADAALQEINELHQEALRTLSSVGEAADEFIDDVADEIDTALATLSNGAASAWKAATEEPVKAIDQFFETLLPW